MHLDQDNKYFWWNNLEWDIPDNFSDDIKQTVHNVLEISYSLWDAVITHYQNPDRSHPHSPTYFLELKSSENWLSRISLKSAYFKVLLELIGYYGTFFIPDKNQQRYMSQLSEFLWSSLITQVKGIGYFIWDVSIVDNLNLQIEQYSIENLNPLNDEVKFSYSGKEYECIWYTLQAGPRKYRFRNIDNSSNDPDFWVTYKEFESIERRVNQLPVSLLSKLDTLYNNQLSKREQLLHAIVWGYTLRQTMTQDDNSKTKKVTIAKKWDNNGEEISLRPVLFSLLEKILQYSWEIFTPDKSDSRYMQELIDVVPSDFIYRIKWLWYYIWNTPTDEELENAKLRLRLKQLVSLDSIFEISARWLQYSCKGFSIQRWWSTYYFESSTWEIIPLPWISFVLLQRLVENPGVIIPVMREDKWAISWIRVAFWDDFLKRKVWQWVYIWVSVSEKEGISQVNTMENKCSEDKSVINKKSIKSRINKPRVWQTQEQKERISKAKNKEKQRQANAKRKRLKREWLVKKKQEAHSKLMSTREDERRAKRESKEKQIDLDRQKRSEQRNENRRIRDAAALLAKQEKEKNAWKRKKTELELKSEKKFIHISGKTKITTLWKFRIDGRVYYKLNINGENKFILWRIYNFLMKLKRNSWKYLQADENNVNLLKRTNAIFKSLKIETMIFYTPWKWMYYWSKPIEKNKIFEEKQWINEWFHDDVAFLDDWADDWWY